MRSETKDLTSPLVKKLDGVPGLVVHRLNSGVAKTVAGGRIRLCREGTPDVLVHQSGVVTYIETKRPGEKATAVQKKEHQRLRAARAWVKTVSSVNDGFFAGACRHLVTDKTVRGLVCCRICGAETVNR